MVKTGQFTTKFKGDSHSSKTAKITSVGLHLERYKHSIISEVTSTIITRCEYDCSTE